MNGALAGRIFPLGPRVVVGRDPRNEVVFPPDAEGVSTRHAQVLTDPHDPRSHLLFDLQSRGGTYVDGERLPPNEPVRLRPGNVVRFGVNGPLAVYDALAALEPAAGGLTLVREDARGSWRLDRAATVGRDQACEVQLDPEKDALASSRHARLIPAFGKAVLTDLGSANGTWLDGKRITELLLPVGAVVRLGMKGPALRLAREGGASSTGRLGPAGRPSTAAPARPAAPGTPPGGTPRPPAGAAHPSGAAPAVAPRASTSAPAAPAPRTSPASASVTPPGGTPRTISAPSIPGASASGGLKRPSSAAPAAAPAPAPEEPAPTPSPAPAAPAPPPVTATPASGATPAVATIKHESFKLEVSGAGARGRVHVFVKTALQLGSYGALNDVVLRCFPRELENDKDSLERSESIGPEHVSFDLTKKGVVLRDLGGGHTKVNGRKLAEGETVVLDALADVSLGEDVLGLRARLFSHPRLPPVVPALGQEHKHPVECLSLERKGDGADHLYLLLVRQASIGSSDDAAIHLDVPGVAAQHALLFVKQGKLWVSQLGEAPVAVAGAPLRPGTAAPIDIGTRFFIGAAQFEMLESAPEDFDPAW